VPRRRTELIGTGPLGDDDGHVLHRGRELGWDLVERVGDERLELRGGDVNHGRTRGDTARTER